MRVAYPIGALVSLLALPGLLGFTLPATAEASTPSGQAVLYIWPSNDRLAKLKAGSGSLPMKALAASPIGRNGTFSLRLPNGADFSRYASAQGDVNLELDAVFDGKRYIESIGLDSAGARSLTGRGRLTRSVHALPLARGGTKPLNRALASQSRASLFCRVKKVKELGPRWVKLTGVYSKNSGTRISYTYKRGSSTRFDAAVSATGPDTGFELSGSNTVSSSGTIGFGTQKGKVSEIHRTQFLFGKFEKACVLYKVGKVVKSWTNRSYEWIGGATSKKSTAPRATYCTNYLKGARFKQDEGRQDKSATGAKFNGVALRSVNSWSATSVTKYAFVGKKGKACGVNGYVPSSKAEQVVLK